MSREQESEGFRNQESSRSYNDLRDHQINDHNAEKQKINTVRHVYLEEENVYGRFAPYLLLKDKLKSQLDSSGNTVLHHMCSHDSPYLPLYLSTLQDNDPVLNTPSKAGHKPIDVAGIYCRKQYVELLKQKGAVDNGNVDHWAIQGGNIQNWTGKVNIQQKHLIHWAAYNDMPQVLKQFYKQGADMNCRDGNDCTPLDLAVINKSYNSVKVLAELGFRPQQKTMQNCDSKSIKQIFRKWSQSTQKKRMFKILKLLYVPLYILLNIFLFGPNENLIVFILLSLSLIYWIFLLVRTAQPEARYLQGRSTAFFSDIIGKQVNLKQNHLAYVILITILFLFGLSSIISCNILTYFSALVFWIVLAMTLSFMANLIGLLYGICKNLTHKQMYNSHQYKHLWRKVKFIEQRQIFTRKYDNPYNKGIKQNIKAYLAKDL